MADLDAAIGYVVAHGDPVDRARLSWLRSGIAPPSEVLDKVELGQRPDGGWPAFWAGNVASVDATCFRLAEIDDLGGLSRPAARKALRWLARRQRPDGTWQEASQETYGNGVRKVIYRDPDGNEIGFGGGPLE